MQDGPVGGKGSTGILVVLLNSTPLPCRVSCPLLRDSGCHAAYLLIATTRAADGTCLFSSSSAPLTVVACLPYHITSRCKTPAPPCNSHSD